MKSPETARHGQGLESDCLLTRLSQLRSASSQKASCKVLCTCQGRSLVLEDTDGVIHQAEAEALEEWRSDKMDSFESNDGCRCSE